MTDDSDDPVDDDLSGGTDDSSESPARRSSGGKESARVARTRYVRSGWGVLFAVGIVVGVVIVTGGFAEFDTDPFCERAEAVAAESAATVTTAQPQMGGLVPEPADPLEEATSRLALYREFRSLLPYDLQDAVDVVIEHEEQVVAAIEAVGEDADIEQKAAAESEMVTDVEAVADALFEIDVYAAGACQTEVPQLVD